MGPVAAASRSALPLLAAVSAAAVLALGAVASPALAGHQTLPGGAWAGDSGRPGPDTSGGAWDEEDVPWQDDEELEPGYDWTAEEVDPDFAGASDDADGPAPAAPQGSKPEATGRNSTRIAGSIRAATVPYGRLIATTARRHGVPVALFTALVWQESGFNAKARSKAGARGLTQLMPATARGLGVRRIYDPVQNLAGGAHYLRVQLLRFRSKRLALAAYNAGPGAVTRYRGVPPFAETRAYVTRVLAREAALRRAGVR